MNFNTMIVVRAGTTRKRLKVEIKNIVCLSFLIIMTISYFQCSDYLTLLN